MGAGRAAGNPSVEFPRMSNFRGPTRSPGTYWLAGNSTTMPVIYWSSAARVVRDVRRAFGLNDGSSYDTALGDRLSARWAEMQPAGVNNTEWSNIIEGIRVGWRDGEVIPLAGLRACIWWAYVRRVHPGGPVSVLFSREIGLPRIGADIGNTDASALVQSEEMDANRMAFNVFSGETPTGGEPVYSPWCSERQGCDPYSLSARTGGKKPGGMAGASTALIVVALLAIAGSSSK